MAAPNVKSTLCGQAYRSTSREGLHLRPTTVLVLGFRVSCPAPTQTLPFSPPDPPPAPDPSPGRMQSAADSLSQQGGRRDGGREGTHATVSPHAPTIGDVCTHSLGVGQPCLSLLAADGWRVGRNPDMGECGYTHRWQGARWFGYPRPRPVYSYVLVAQNITLTEYGILV